MNFFESGGFLCQNSMVKITGPLPDSIGHFFTYASNSLAYVVPNTSAKCNSSSGNE